ncbi:MAG: cytochrome c biogenesis protein CcdA [Heteroscytonema crispum UTEX LB 1556]
MLSKKESEPSVTIQRRPKKILVFSLLAGGVFLLILAANHFQNLYISLENIVSVVENIYQQWLERQNTSSPFVLIPLAFVGGLIASVSPCILSLLPVNLSYIGTLNITSRKDAFVKAGLFVLGVMTLFSMFGLFSSFASAVLVEFKGYINIIVGAVIILMGLSFAGLFHLPLPQTNFSLPFNSPYGVGLTFALVSSPCASPVLFAVLAAAAATGSIALSTITMVSYALGYTAVIFFASLFTGLVKQSRVLLSKSEWVIRLGSAALILAGGYYLYSGISWFF